MPGLHEIENTYLKSPELLICTAEWLTKTVGIHYGDVIMGAIGSQITSLTIVYSTVYSDAEQRKHQSSASLAFVRGIPRFPVNSPHKWPVTRKMFPFDDIIMTGYYFTVNNLVKSLQYGAVTSNGSWCMGIKGEMSGTVCVTFTWYMYIYELFIAFVCFVVCSLL